MGMYPDDMGRFAERINEFLLEVLRPRSGLPADAQWYPFAGDIAYTRGLLFSPDYWRRYFNLA